MNLRKRSIGAWAKERPGSLNGSNDTNWMEPAGHVNTLGDPIKAQIRINQEIEQMVIAARRRLENKLYTQIGVLNIFWQLRQEGIKPLLLLPSIVF